MEEQLVIGEEAEATKVCSCCKERKPLSCYRMKLFRNKVLPDRRRPGYTCIECDKLRAKRIYQRDKAKIAVKLREYYVKNRERAKEYSRAWRKNNRDKVNRSVAKCRKIRYRIDIQNRINCVLRSRISAGIRNGIGFKKPGCTTEKLLGCKWAEIRAHLESQFLSGMTWDNYGWNGWHIDHHIPVAAWDMTNDHHQRACFNYRNLKPLWKLDNFRKHDCLPPGWQDYMAMLLEVTREPQH